MLSFYQAWFRIGETLVEQSKQHITAEVACNEIRKILQNTEKPERQRNLYRYENTYPDCPTCGHCRDYGCDNMDVCTVEVAIETDERIGTPSHWTEVRNET